MSVSVRWVDNCCCINERTIGLLQLPNTLAETIFQSGERYLNQVFTADQSMSRAGL